MAKDRPVAGWDDLSDAERLVLQESRFGHSLIDILNAWVPNPDAAYWNRKGPYVQELVEASITLLRADLVDVWKPSAGGQIRLDVETAEWVLQDAANWWWYDPDGNWDPSEDLSRYDGYEQSEADGPEWDPPQYFLTDGERAKGDDADRWRGWSEKKGRVIRWP